MPRYTILIQENTFCQQALGIITQEPCNAIHIYIYIFIHKTVANFLLEISNGQIFRGFQMSKDSVPVVPIGSFETFPLHILSSNFKIIANASSYSLLWIMVKKKNHQEGHNPKEKSSATHQSSASVYW